MRTVTTNSRPFRKITVHTTAEKLALRKAKRRNGPSAQRRAERRLPLRLAFLAKQNGFFLDKDHCEICAPQEQRLERRRCDMHAAA